ncbi:MAG: FG-GAP repeat protein [Planctomycetes bacterium]|nr:FG-GAP repeat protein [Planctomycetota bacterium]
MKLLAVSSLFSSLLALSVAQDGVPPTAGATSSIVPLAEQAYMKASNAGANDLFGRAVAMSGNTLVVGAWGEDSNSTGVNGKQKNEKASNSGAAYVFTRVGTTWTQEAYLKASNAEHDDEFGRSVAISGDTIVVGAPEESSGAAGVGANQSDNSLFGAGAAYVFVRSNGVWTQQAYLKASNPDGADNFGASVAISGDTVVVGAELEDGGSSGVGGDQSSNNAIDSGSAYVFARTGQTWVQQAYLKASNTGAGDNFGGFVAASNGRVFVGARLEDSSATGVDGNGADENALDSGAVYVFSSSGSTWVQEAYIKASNTNTGDLFGKSLAVSGDTLVVGAPGEASSATGVGGDQNSNGAPNSGAVYVFLRSGSNWSQQGYLKASNTGASDQFGWSVAVDGDLLAVGARHEDGGAIGVDGDGSDNSAEDAGATYAYVRSAGVWAFQSYIKTSNTDAGDVFGYSVAVVGTAIASGALGESSKAVGIQGDSSNDSASFAGAAYVYDQSGTLKLPKAKGKLTDLAASGKDTFQIQCDFAALPGEPQFTFNPAIQSMDLLIGSEAAPISITIPAGDPGWKGAPAAAPTKFTWKSAAGVLPKSSVVLDLKKRTLNVKVSSADWSAPPVNPMGLDVSFGTDGGRFLGAWVQKKPGSFSFPK